MNLEKETRLMDVGGYEGTWLDVPSLPKITLFNLPEYFQIGDKPDQFEYIFGDGRALPYDDGEFDIIFSNSVIEHVGTYEDQMMFANEARRVGKNCWIQTPAKEFPIEPHLLTPFIHWLPLNWIPTLLQHFTVWGWMTHASKEEAKIYWERLKLRPLTYREMKELFPDCEIIVERFLGMPKSYTACRKMP